MCLQPSYLAYQHPQQAPQSVIAAASRQFCMPNFVFPQGKPIYSSNCETRKLCYLRLERCARFSITLVLLFTGCPKSNYSMCMDGNMAAPHQTMQLNPPLLNHPHAALLPMSFLEQSARPMLVPVSVISMYFILRSMWVMLAAYQTLAKSYCVDATRLFHRLANLSDSEAKTARIPSHVQC